MPDRPLIAHSRNAAGERHGLDEHTQAVRREAAASAAPVGASATAEWAALLHDLGKALPAFQQYLRDCEEAARTGRRPPPPGTAPHAIWGAAVAHTLMSGPLGAALDEIAGVVAGHHAGLTKPADVTDRINVLAPDGEAMRTLAQALVSLGLPARSPEPPPGDDPSAREMRARFVLSALADADFLDTERHFQSGRAAVRGGAAPMADLAGRVRRQQDDLMASLDEPDSDVNRIRREVHEACVEAASARPGFFRLTVPTGGGKTRSGLAFALEHARAHGLRHIVVALPYTSIVDQTADVYTRLLGRPNVLVHHSQSPVPPHDTGEASPVALRQRLAAENWDAPVVVTTTVQLFESLFSRRPSRVRKLHRLARSVIVLDEVQALPPAVLLPTLDALRLLVGWGATVVFSSATQPGFEAMEALSPMRGQPVTEIVPSHAPYFEALDRVAVEHRREPVSWDALADEVASLDHVMVILNARRDAVDLARRLADAGEAGVMHLSTLLTGAHRRLVLRRVRQRLRDGRPVRLISTQVVEAGVDLDFPVVFRALGPLDRLVQAAGRCNREGHLGRRGGRFVVFEPAGGGAPRGAYRRGTGLARDALAGGADRIKHLDVQRDYFDKLYADPKELDACDVQAFRLGLAGVGDGMDYVEVERRYRLIPDDTVPVLVVGREGRRAAVEARLHAWEQAGDRSDFYARRHAWRRLQPFVVNVFERQLDLLRTSPHFESLGDDLLHVWRGTYDPLLGLPLDLTDPADLAYDPSDLIS